jgi:hypothetical protein
MRLTDKRGERSDGSSSTIFEVGYLIAAILGRKNKFVELIVMVFALSRATAGRLTWLSPVAKKAKEGDQKEGRRAEGLQPCQALTRTWPARKGTAAKAELRS